MRRILTILITAILGLGPSLAAIPANAFTSAQSGWSGKVDDAKLPACCRRNGAHHCTMGAHASASGGGSTNHPAVAIISAKSCCPCLPNTPASVASQSAALTQASLTLDYPAASQPPAPAASHVAQSIAHTWPTRGPPAAFIL